MGFWDSGTQGTAGPLTVEDRDRFIAALRRPEEPPVLVVSPRMYFRMRWRRAITETCAPLLSIPPSAPVADVPVSARHR